MANVIEQRRVLSRSVEHGRERNLKLSRENETLAEKLDSFALLLSFQVPVTRHQIPRRRLVDPQRFSNTSLFLKNCPQHQRPAEPTRPRFGVNVSLPNFTTMNTRILRVLDLSFRLAGMPE
jgi:hypothetical protein